MAVLSLADAKTHLNIEVTDYDTELGGFIDSAEASIAQQVGPLSTATVTARVPGYAWNLYLPIYPAVSLTSVTVVGSSTPLTLGDLHLEQRLGQVSYNGGAFFSANAYDITYTSGRSPVPADLVMAVKKLLKAMWNDQRGGGVRPGSASEIPIPASLFPRDVEQLLEPYQQKTIGA